MCDQQRALFLGLSQGYSLSRQHPTCAKSLPLVFPHPPNKTCLVPLSTWLPSAESASKKTPLEKLDARVTRLRVLDHQQQQRCFWGLQSRPGEPMPVWFMVFGDSQLLYILYNLLFLTSFISMFFTFRYLICNTHCDLFLSAPLAWAVAPELSQSWGARANWNSFLSMQRHRVNVKIWRKMGDSAPASPHGSRLTGHGCRFV